MSIFNERIPIFKPRRSSQNLSHFHLTTSYMGKVVPVACLPVEPGDKWWLGVTGLTRCQPLFAPVMAQLRTRFAWYFVPQRILQRKFPKFYTSAGEFSLPSEKVPKRQTVTWNDFLNTFLFDRTKWKCSLLDYLRYPYIGDSPSEAFLTKQWTLDALAAYNLIWSEWMRNQNIQEELDIERWQDLDGPFAEWSDDDKAFAISFLNNLQPRNINWRKDYLTAAQPWTQKGTEVLIPLNVTLENFILQAQQAGVATLLGLNEVSGDVKQTGYSLNIDSVASKYDTQADLYATFQTASGVLPAEGIDANLKDFAASGGDSSTLTHVFGNTLTFTARDNSGQPKVLKSGLTVNEFRQSVAIQRFLESRARGGTRLVEYLLVQHGVRMSDKTAQRPQFLGGSDIPLQIGEILQTSESTSSSKMGSFAGSGYGRGAAASTKFFAEEPGLLMCLSWTTPPTSYMWGTPRYLHRTDPLDFMNPHFVHLGEQEIYNFEAMREYEDPDGVFGYIGRYDDLRTHPDIVTGDFRDTLTDWHLARNNVEVALNEDFIRANPDTRIFNYTGASHDHLLHQLHITAKSKRNIPRVSIPKI